MNEKILLLLANPNLSNICVDIARAIKQGQYADEIGLLAGGETQAIARLQLLSGLEFEVFLNAINSEYVSASRAATPEELKQFQVPTPTL